MLALLIFLAVWGLIVGALARLALPGPDPMGIFATIGLGLAGSFVGGLLAGLLWAHSAGFVFSLVGSILAALPVPPLRPAPAADRPGRTAAAAALAPGERTAGGERPVVALPDVREDRERAVVDLVDVQAARLAEPARARLSEAGGDRDDDRSRVVRDGLELVPLADRRLVDVPGEDEVGARPRRGRRGRGCGERPGACAPPATALRSCGGGGRRRGTRLRRRWRGARPRRGAGPRAGRRSGGGTVAPSSGRRRGATPTRTWAPSFPTPARTRATVP